MTYVFTDDYKTDMHRHIDTLYNEAKTSNTSRERRLTASDTLVEDYVAHSGERPDGNALERLATLILRDELTDAHPDKMAREEYPILSDTQREEREKDEILTDFNSEDDDDTNANHSRLNTYLASDGKSYRTPIRRTRDIGELIQEDYAKSRKKNVESPVNYRRNK